MQRMRGRKLTIRCAALLLCLCTVLCGCGGRSGGSTDGDKPLVMVTIEPVRYFTERIAGGLVQVESMVPRGSNPEAYDPTPRQMMRLGGSTAYLGNGGYLGFEQSWLERLRQNAAGTRFFDLSEGMDLIADGHEAAGIDPHIWCSCANARIMARNILNALILLDEANAGAYTAGCDSLLAEIDRTDSIIRQKTGGIKASRSFVIYHPALTYYAAEYGLEQIPIEKDGKEPSAAGLKDIIDSGVEKHVRVVFIQPEFDRHNAEAIAEQIGARIVDINPISYDWAAEMVHIAKSLQTE